MNYFFNTAPSSLIEKADLNSNFNPTGNIEFNPKTFFMRPVTKSEIIPIISGLKSKSFNSAKIPNRLLKVIAEPLSEHLRLIINLAIETNVFPDCLKIARIIPIPKKGQSCEIANFRPISTLNPLAKIFEKIIFNRIYSFFEDNNLLCPQQFGFQKGKSTEQACINFLQAIINSHNNNTHSQAVFVDLRKAFDCVSHQPLINKLYKYGIRGGSQELINSYSTNRKHFTEVDGTRSESLSLNIGVPQGSALGPLFFLIYINDIVKLPLKSKLLLYADDLVLYTESSDFGELKETLENDLELLNEWFKSNKLILNIEKTKSMLFTRCKFKSNPIKYNNQFIEEVEHYKYLGLTIQSNLKFDMHLNYISKKINSVNGSIYGLKNLVPRYVLVKIFYALVYHHINYHILAWGGSNPSLIKRVNVSVNKTVRNIDKSETSTVDKYRNLKILTVNQVYKLRLGQMMHDLKFKRSCLLRTPDIYWSHEYSRRNPNLFRLPHTSTEVGRRSFINNGVLLWATLPEDITNTVGSFTFKNKLKEHLLNEFDT